MEIRGYANTDYESVIALINTLPEWFDDDARNRSIPIDLEFHKTLLAIEDSSVVGFITLFVYEGRLVIGWLGVHRDRRRKGIGSLLLSKAEIYGAENGLAELVTYTLGDNVDYPPYEATRAFYYKNGFKVYQRATTDNEGCPEEIKIRKRIA